MGDKWKRRKRRAALRRLRNRAILPFLRGGLSLLSLLPLGSASRLGAALGRIGFCALVEDRKKALRNLGQALGNAHPASRLRGIAIESFQTLGASALEWIVLSRRPAEQAVRAVVGLEGEEHLDAALSRGRGAVIITAHFGLFELIPIYFSVRGLTGKVVGRRQSDEGLEALISERRSRLGVETIPQQQPREIFRVLRRGEVVGILPDQDIDKLPGIFVPFFGRPAYTVIGPATLLVTTGAPIVPMFIHRLGHGRHRIVVRPAISDPAGEKEERIRSITEEFTRVFEEEISAAPEHWAWIHERWSTTPEKLARRKARRSDESARVTRKRIYGRGRPRTTDGG